MLNSLQTSSTKSPFYYDPKECFHLVIDYPSTEKDYLFQQQAELLDKIGCSMGLLISSYLLLPNDQRNDPAQLEYLIANEICSYAQSMIDSIECVIDADGEFVPVDPDDQFAYAHATEAIYGAYGAPLTAWTIARHLMELFKYYYGHVLLPEDMDICDDWDYDIAVFGDMAVIQFNTPENKNIFNQLLTF